MKKLIIAASVFITISATQACAQTPEAAPQQQPTAPTEQKTAMKGKKAEMMKELNLTDEQKKQLAPMQKEERAKKEKIMNDTTLSADQKKEQMKALREESISKMSKILTPEQMQKLKELRAKGKE